MSSFGTVLIVDNDEFALIELERVLEGAGFNTTTTWDVSEAVHLANTTDYDYILVGECFSGRNAEELWHSNSSGGRAQQRVILSARNIVLGTDLPTAGPITICKRRANDVLRALSGEHDRSLARAA
jgi:CheY-like chemotaxis protein